MNVRNIIVAFLGAASLMGSSRSSAQEPGLPSLKEIRERTFARTGRIETIEMNWSLRTRVLKGSMTPRPSRRERAADPENLIQRNPVPAEDVEMHESAHLTLAGASRALDRTRDGFNVTDSAPMRDMKDRYVIHEGLQKTLSLDRMSGTVSKPQLGEYQNVAATMFHPQHLPHRFNYLTNPAFAVLRSETIDGGERIIVGNTNLGESGVLYRFEYYLDPARDFLPVKLKSMKKTGELRAEIRVDYKSDGISGYKPSEIHITEMNEFEPGKIASSTIMTVDDITFNDPVDPSVFDLVFPPGTTVYDSILAKQYTVGLAPGGESWTDIFTAEPDAPSVEPEPGEKEIPGLPVRPDPPGSAPAPDASGDFPLGWVIGAFVLIVGGTFLLARIKRSA